MNKIKNIRFWYFDLDQYAFQAICLKLSGNDFYTSTGLPIRIASGGKLIENLIMIST